MDQDSLAEMLDVSLDSIKQWRTKAFANKPQYLRPDGKRGRKSTYSVTVILDWLERNPSYHDRVFALIYRQPVQPTPQPEQVPASAGKGLFGIASHAPIPA